MALEKQVGQFGRFLALQANSKIQIGTLFTNVSFGLTSTAGLFDSPLLSNSPKHRLQLFAFVHPSTQVIAYDATLQGGMFNRDSPYTIARNSIERITAQLNYGVVLKTKYFYVEYSFTKLSPEFEGGRTAKWGGIRLGVSF